MSLFGRRFYRPYKRHSMNRWSRMNLRKVLGIRNAIKQRNYERALKNRWRFPSIKYDGAFRKKSFRRGDYKYTVKSALYPRSVNGGYLKYYRVKGFKKTWK